jgi:hypothetical protein
VNELRHLYAALSVLGKLGGGSSYTKLRHTMSASARKRMSPRAASAMRKGEESSAETQVHNINGRTTENRGGAKGEVG